MAPRRVLLLVDVYHAPYGGTEGQIRTLVSHLPDGWTAEVWALRSSTWFDRGDFPCPTRVLHIGSLKSPRSWWRIHRLARAIRRGGFDVIHTWMNDASVVGPVAARWAGRPVLISRRDLGFWQNARWQALLRRSDRLATGVVANSAAVAAHVAASEHVPPALIDVVHNGQSRRNFDVARDPALRARLGVAEDAPVIGFLGNMKPLKRQDDLLVAVAQLRRRHPALQVWFIGDEYDHSEPILERALSAPIRDAVRVFRIEGNVAPALRHLSVGVLCSEQEGLSNAILEYMGCGLPVVASDVGGNAELVADGENGYLYEAGDVGALTRHLERLLSDPERARKMGAASRRRYEEKFDVDTMVGNTIRLYEQVSERGGAPQRPALQWEVVREVEALEAIAAAWAALLSDGAWFCGPDWALAAFCGPVTSGTPHVLLARDERGMLVGVLPLEQRRGGTLAFVGQGRGADHMDVVARPGWRRAVAEGALEHLAALPWRRLALHHLAEDGALRQALRRRGWPYRERHATDCPYLPIVGTWPEFLQNTFRRGLRRNIRRYVQRFLQTPGAALQSITAPAEAAQAVDRYYALHERRFAARGEMSAVTRRLQPFHRRLAERAARRGCLRITFLVLDGQDAACEYAFVHGGRMYAFQAGWDEEASVDSPGLVLRALVLERFALGEGLHEYDFLDGDESYKAQWTDRTRRLFDVEVHRPTRLGRLGSVCLGLPRFVRDVLLRRGSFAGAERA